MDKLELIFDNSSQDEHPHADVAKRREQLGISARLAMIYELEEVPAQHRDPREFRVLGNFEHYAALEGCNSSDASVYFGGFYYRRLLIRLGDHIHIPADRGIGVLSFGERHVRFRRVGTGIEILQIV